MISPSMETRQPKTFNIAFAYVANFLAFSAKTWWQVLSILSQVRITPNRVTGTMSGMWFLFSINMLTTEADTFNSLWLVYVSANRTRARSRNPFQFNESSKQMPKCGWLLDVTVRSSVSQFAGSHSECNNVTAFSPSAVSPDDKNITSAKNDRATLLSSRSAPFNVAKVPTSNRGRGAEKKR